MASSFDTESETIEFDNLAKLAENLIYLLPGCADVMVRKTLQDVYRDFCRRSCCLRGRRRFDGTRHDFAVAPVFGGVVDCVAQVVRNGRALRIGMDYGVVDGPVPRVVLSGRYAQGNARDEVVVECIEIPSITSEQIPSHIIQKYGEALVAGALSRLQAMTGRAWTDTAQAASNMLRYENAVGEARMRYHFGGDSSSGSMEYLPDSSGLI